MKESRLRNNEIQAGRDYAGKETGSNTKSRRSSHPNIPPRRSADLPLGVTPYLPMPDRQDLKPRSEAHWQSPMLSVLVRLDLAHLFAFRWRKRWRKRAKDQLSIGRSGRI